MSKRELQNVVNAVRKYKSFVVFGHQNLDGDSLGSMLALTLGLRPLGKMVYPASSTPISDKYMFLPQAKAVHKKLPTNFSFDAALILECAAEKIIDPLYQKVKASGTLILNIDHHATNPRYGDIVYLDTGAAACGEQIHDLLCALKVKITRPVAECLYLSIMTDTGNFRFPNTDERTFGLAKKLVEAGAKPNLLYRKIYEEKSLENLKFLATALSELKTDSTGSVAWSVITREAFKSGGFKDLDSQEAIDHIRSLKGVRVALIFKEMKNGTVKVSARSQGDVNVARLAQQFGGGGHPGAAAMTLKIGLERAIKEVLQEAVKAVK